MSDDFPPVGGNTKKKAAVKFNDQFNEAFEDEFSEGDPESPNEANNEDEDEDEEEDGDGDFDANELLNMASYQQKRLGMGQGLGRDKESPLPSLNPLSKALPQVAPISKVAPPAPPAPQQKPPSPNRSFKGTTATVGADEAFEFSDEDDVESSVEEIKAPNIDFDRFNYKTTDLNKLPDAELKAHKAAMEVGFSANAVKKGDPGFKYDKRVNFKYNAEQAAENSWDDSEDEEEEEEEEVVAASRVLTKPKGLGLVSREEEHVPANADFDDENDNAYFDDDFDDDFQ